ncbi:hypothetical protein ACC689_35905, partial [Rhizobium ruizarguesonis]
SAGPITTGIAETAISAVGEILSLLATLGQDRRTRDIDPALLRARFPAMEGIPFNPSRGSPTGSGFRRRPISQSLQDRSR